MNKKLREQAAMLASALAFCTADDSTGPAPIEIERIVFGCEHYEAWQLAYETSWRSTRSSMKERYAEAHAMLMNGEVD